MTRDFLLSYLLSSLEKVALQNLCYQHLYLALRVSQQDDHFFREKVQRE